MFPQTSPVVFIGHGSVRDTGLSPFAFESTMSPLPFPSFKPSSLVRLLNYFVVAKDFVIFGVLLWFLHFRVDAEDFIFWPGSSTVVMLLSCKPDAQFSLSFPMCRILTNCVFPSSSTLKFSSFSAGTLSIRAKVFKGFHFLHFVMF